MKSNGLDESAWRDETNSALDAIAAWRREHPRATFTEIEGAVDEHLRSVRAQVIQDVVEASAAAGSGEQTERPLCATCGKPMHASGAKTRRITNHRGESVDLQRMYYHCPRCRAGLFPPG